MADTANVNGGGVQAGQGPASGAGQRREALQRVIMSLVANQVYSRSELWRSLGGDPRRSLADECGHPQGPVSPKFYQDLYESDPVAARVVEVYPDECWQAQPSVYEDEDPDVQTPFEEAWDSLGKQLRGEWCYYQDEHGSPVWDYLYRADVLSGVGQYGAILLGLDDGKPLDQPAEVRTATASPAATAATAGGGSSTSTRRLLFMRVFPESLAPVTRWETDQLSPRFGQPTEYLITLADSTLMHGQPGVSSQGPAGTATVHWTRVVHVADNLESSEVLGAPRMRAVLPRLMDIQKILGADAEGYYRNCILKLFFETHPSLGGDVEVDRESLKDDVEQMMNGLQQWMGLSGMQAKAIPPAVADPTPHVLVQIQAICIRLKVPMRVFMGSERGELASTQDEVAWQRRLRGRRVYCLTPRYVCPLVDRLIMLGVLPEPEGYSVYWPQDGTGTDTERANVSLVKTQALRAYVEGGVESVIPPLEYLTGFLGIPDEEAQSILEAAVEHAEEVEAEQEEIEAAAEERAAEMVKEQARQGPAVPPVGGGGGVGTPPARG